MEIKALFEIAIGVVCTLGFGLGFFIFGVCIGRNENEPFAFWANGKRLNHKKVTDIPSYNRACGRILRLFSLPLSISGVGIMLSFVNNLFAVVSLVILVLWGTLGLWWLIHSYRKIEKQYILR